jgi:hypothetical protein
MYFHTVLGRFITVREVMVTRKRERAVVRQQGYGGSITMSFDVRSDDVRIAAWRTDNQGSTSVKT